MLVFRGPVVVFLSAEECVMRLAVCLASSVPVAPPDRGEAERAPALLAPALRKGEGVRPTTGGVAVRETGGVGFLMAGLSQDEKKSSVGSPAGVLVPSLTSMSLITTSLGYLNVSRLAGL